MKLGLVLACALCGAPARAGGPQFSAALLRQDLAYLDRSLHEMPADLAHSADVAQLEHAIHDMDASLGASPPLDRDGAWRMFATLNPLLGDGHLAFVRDLGGVKGQPPPADRLAYWAMGTRADGDSAAAIE